MPRRPPEPTLPSYSDLYPKSAWTPTRRLKPVVDTAGVLYRDVEEVGLNAIASARASASRDLVLITADLHQLDIATNLVANLADVGVHNYVVLGNRPPTCEAVRGRLACVWSTLLEPKYRARLRGAMTNEVRTMWLLRQIYFGRLVGLGYNPMLLDADVILFRDPLALIAAELPGYAARNYLAQFSAAQFSDGLSVTSAPGIRRTFSATRAPAGWRPTVERSTRAAPRRAGPSTRSGRTSSDASGASAAAAAAAAAAARTPIGRSPPPSLRRRAGRY